MIGFQEGICTWGSDDLESQVHEAFSATGVFSHADDFEYRPEQQRMATAVARALSQDTSLLIEAGTGVCKSIGYLLPAVKFALANQRKAIISTHTINLQEQLFGKDIPILKQALGTDFSAALLKGRQNYVCLTRLQRALVQSDDLFSSSESGEVRRIAEMVRQGCTDRSDFNFRLSPKVWASICSTRSNG